MLQTSVSTAAPSVDPTDHARVRLLLHGAVENLLTTWDARRALFNFTSHVQGGRVENDYDHPIAVRYTINTLLGLAEAARNGTLGVSDAQVRGLADAFLATVPERVTLAADHGLLLVLRTALGAPGSELHGDLRRVRDILGAGASRLNVHDVAWLTWGAAAAARAGAPGGEDAVRAGLRLLESDFTEPATGLPRHVTSRWRRRVVSFGSLVYFLRALHEAATVLGEPRARTRFERGVARALSLQGPQGEWPWMIDNRTGRIVDPYPVFAVHQDAMAMLFLHPAQDAGDARAAAAASRSLAWDFGRNELQAPMWARGRYFIAYRSIERAEAAPRARRYARSLAGAGRARSAPFGARRLRINSECRSYHLGWILYVWSGRPEGAP